MASRSKARSGWPARCTVNRPAADAARRIDMTAHKTHFPTIAGPDVNVPAVSRPYDVIERRADQ